MSKQLKRTGKETSSTSVYLSFPKQQVMVQREMQTPLQRFNLKRSILVVLDIKMIGRME
jgi:hypothetical protein